MSDFSRRTLIAMAGAIGAGMLASRTARAATASGEPIQLFNVLPVKPGHLNGFLAVMRANASASRKEAGNRGFDVFLPEGGGDTLYLFERWESREALARHMTLPHLKAVVARVPEDLDGKPTSLTLTEVEPPSTAPTAVAAADRTRTVVVDLHCKPDRRQAFLDAFAPVIPASRKAPGNLAFSLHRNVDDPNNFVVFERWRDVASHEAHLRQPYSTALDAVLPETLARPAMAGRHLLSDVASA